MSNFISNYFQKLRQSDEKTKHRSAMTISIVISVIILSLAFIFLKDFIFSPSNKNLQNENIIDRNVEENRDSQKDKNKIPSPFSSLSNFIKDTGEQFSSMKSIFSGAKEDLKKLEK